MHGGVCMKKKFWWRENCAAHNAKYSDEDNVSLGKGAASKVNYCQQRGPVRAMTEK